LTAALLRLSGRSRGAAFSCLTCRAQPSAGPLAPDPSGIGPGPPVPADPVTTHYTDLNFSWREWL